MSLVELTEHAVAVEAILERLVTGPEGTTVALPGVGEIAVRVYRPFVTRDPLTGAELPSSGKRLPVFQRAENVAQDDAAIAALASCVARELRSGTSGERAVSLPRLGLFHARKGDDGDEVIEFRAASVLKRRIQGAVETALPDDVLDAALGHLRGADFGVRDLQAMLASVSSTKEPEDDVLVDLPRGVPDLMRAALARSAELSNDDTLGFFTPLQREWATRDFRDDDRADAPLDVFLFSGAPQVPRPPGSPAKVWALRLSDFGAKDPEVVWCANRAGLDAATHRAPLTTWVQMFALETAILLPALRHGWFLGRAQAARLREVAAAACPAIAPLVWPAASIDEAADPWLRTLMRIVAF